MCIKTKFIKHITNTDNIGIYLLILFVVIYESFNDGFWRAINGLANVGFFIAGILVVVLFITSLREKSFSLKVSDMISLSYYILYSAYWFIEHGFTKMSFLILTPIAIGGLLMLAYIFSLSDVYQKTKKNDNDKNT